MGLLIISWLLIICPIKSDFQVCCRRNKQCSIVSVRAPRWWIWENNYNKFLSSQELQKTMTFWFYEGMFAWLLGALPIFTSQLSPWTANLSSLLHRYYCAPLSLVAYRHNFPRASASKIFLTLVSKIWEFLPALTFRRLRLSSKNFSGRLNLDVTKCMHFLIVPIAFLGRDYRGSSYKHPLHKKFWNGAKPHIKTQILLK